MTQRFCHTDSRKLPRKEWDKQEEAITWNEKNQSSYTEVICVKQKRGFKEGIVNYKAGGIREDK